LPDRQPEIIANEVDGSDEDADDFDQFELDLLGGDSANRVSLSSIAALRARA
jgi:hypothetical protein